MGVGLFGEVRSCHDLGTNVVGLLERRSAVRRSGHAEYLDQSSFGRRRLFEVLSMRSVVNPQLVLGYADFRVLDYSFGIDREVANPNLLRVLSVDRPDF